jgi:hypothetical protein
MNLKNFVKNFTTILKITINNISMNDEGTDLRQFDYIDDYVKTIQTVDEKDFGIILDIVDIHDNDLYDFDDETEVHIGIDKNKNYYLVLFVPNEHDDEFDEYSPYGDNYSLRENKYYVNHAGWDKEYDNLYFKVPREKKTLVENYLKNNNPHY